MELVNFSSCFESIINMANYLLLKVQNSIIGIPQQFLRACQAAEKKSVHSMQQSVTPVEQQAFISFHASHLFRGNDKNKNSHIKRAPFIILFGLAYILQLRRGACASRQIKKDASFFYCPKLLVQKLLIFICYFNPHSLSYLPSFIISFWFF